MCQTIARAVRCCMLADPCVNLGYTLWVVSNSSSSCVCSLLRDCGVNTAGTLSLNRRHVLQVLQPKKVAKRETVTAECNGILELTIKHSVTAEALI
jgi:hypothetical protein